MENKNKRVFLLTLFCFLLYFFTSIIFQVFGFSWKPFDRINLIADIFPRHEPSEDAARKTLVVKVKPQQDFELYKQGNLITNFYKNDSAVLPNFLEKLQKLKNGEKIKIRIAYFGDSMIEGDLLTQTLRKALQNEYGGSGVGYIPIYSNVSSFRQTASCKASGWDDVNFKTKDARNLYFSGHKFFGKGSGTYTDKTIKDSVAQIQKSIIYGKCDHSNLYVNGENLNLTGEDLVNRKVLSNDNSHSVSIKSTGVSGPLYGVSFESESGIFVDNFSFRGITGVELKKLDEDFIKSIQKTNHYDLIVFQYGVNLLFRPNDTDYSHYVKMMSPVLKKFKQSIPDAEFLIVSSADRAFRYNDEYKSAIGLPNLLESQAKLALDNGFAFYNQFATMGGTNSIVKWATENPPLANKDYVHPNAKGADILGEKLFEAIQKEYKKYNNRKH